jgi:hypothetical protein
MREVRILGLRTHKPKEGPESRFVDHLKGLQGSNNGEKLRKWLREGAEETYMILFDTESHYVFQNQFLRPASSCFNISFNRTLS